MGVHEALVSGIPGLKGETWGTLRVKGRFLYGLEPVPFKDGCWVVSRVAVFRVLVASVHQLEMKNTVGRNRKARLGFPWRAFS
jgi:hypothetical protein